MDVIYCSDDGVLCYVRGADMAVAFNPTDEERSLPYAINGALFTVGDYLPKDGETLLKPQTAVIFRLNRR